MRLEKRAVNLLAEAYGAQSDAERDSIRAVYAYEKGLTAQNGRKTRASRTWQMIKRYGILPAVERAVNREAETLGYARLLEAGWQDYAFEAVVARYPDWISPEALQRSRTRLEEGHHAALLGTRTS
ncbi:MAG: hypothetical protein ACYCTF_03095 [Acidiferrobacter sp.]